MLESAINATSHTPIIARYHPRSEAVHGTAHGFRRLFATPLRMAASLDGSTLAIPFLSEGALLVLGTFCFLRNGDPFLRTAAGGFLHSLGAALKVIPHFRPAPLPL